VAPDHELTLRVRARPPTAAYARSALTVRSSASAILPCQTTPRRCSCSATEIAGTICWLVATAPKWPLLHRTHLRRLIVSEPPMAGPKGEIHGWVAPRWTPVHRRTGRSAARHDAEASRDRV